MEKYVDPDIVKVVRCKDCKWYDQEDCFCNNFAVVMWDDDFCSEAIRGKKNERDFI